MTATTIKILVVDDEPDICSLLQEILEDEGYQVETAQNATDAIELQKRQQPDLILLDIWMPDMDGISLLKGWRDGGRLDYPVIMMSGHGTVETAVEATRLGAYDFIEKPLTLAKLLVTIRNALRHYNLQRENSGLRHSGSEWLEPIGHSAIVQSLREQCQRIAEHDAPVLIQGEPGCGKRLFARYLHHLSPRHAGPFIAANLPAHNPQACIALLFGSEAGEEPGLLQQAGNGTLLLDDIADLDEAVQLQLLTALAGKPGEEGGAECRLIAATRQPLQQLVEAEKFRQELYYRISVFPLFIPPLRQHREDVPDLLGFYVDHFTDRDKLPYRSFTTAAQNRLRQYDWPGNITELKNLVQRLLILGNGEQIEIDEVEEALGQSRERIVPLELNRYRLPLKQAREQFERDYFAHLLGEYDGSVNRVAQHAGVERTHLYRKLRLLGLDAKSFVKRAK